MFMATPPSKYLLRDFLPKVKEYKISNTRERNFSYMRTRTGRRSIWFWLLTFPIAYFYFSKYQTVMDIIFIVFPL